MAAAASPALLGQEQPEATAFDELEVKIHRESSRPDVSVGVGPYIELDIPRAITDWEHARYASMLVLSRPQRQEADRLYEQHVEADAAIRNQVEAPLWQRSHQLAIDPTFPRTIEHADRFDALLEDRSQLIARLARVERAYLDGLIPILTEKQLASLDHIRLRRRRDRCAQTEPRLPGSRVDLEFIIDQLCFSENSPITPHDMALLDELLLEYSSVMTPLFEEREREALRMLGESQRLVAESLEYMDSGPPRATQVFEDTEQRRAAGRQRVIQVARRIQTLNDNFLDRILEALSPADGDRVLTAYRSAVYSSVYPDPFGIERLLETALRLPDLAAEQTAEIERQREFYHALQRGLGQRMLATYLDWRAQPVTTRARGQSEYREYSESMLAFQQTRREYANQIWNAVKGVLNERQLEELLPACRIVDESAARFDRMLSEREESGPGWPGRME